MVLQENAVVQGLVPTLDLALRLRMVRRAADVVNALVLVPSGNVIGDVR